MTLQQRENELNEKWYSTKIVAQILGMDRSYVNFLINRGDIKAVEVPGKGRYGKAYKISESELEKFEVFRAMKKEGKNVEIEGDHIVEKGDISEESVEKVPMTKEEIMNRLPDELKERLNDIEAIKRDQDSIRDQLISYTRDVRTDISEIRNKLNNRDETIINSIQSLISNSEDYKELYFRVYDEVFRTVADRYFKMGYEEGFKSGSYMKRQRYGYSNRNESVSRAHEKLMEGKSEYDSQD